MKIQTLIVGLVVLVTAAPASAQLDRLLQGLPNVPAHPSPSPGGLGDAQKILSGGDTAATQYFKGKTTDTLTAAFRPMVEKSMNEVGVIRQYRELVGRAQAIPFLKSENLDLDQYLVGKGLDGLFHVLGDEERKIRTNPAARVTDLLKDVFGK